MRIFLSYFWFDIISRLKKERMKKYIFNMNKNQKLNDQMNKNYYSFLYYKNI